MSQDDANKIESTATAADEKEDDSVSEPITSIRGFVLTSGDIDIFRLLYEYRILRREHLSALTGRPAKRLHRRLHILLGRGYLSSIRLPQQKHIYGLGKAALPALVEEGIADTEILSQRIRIHELKELFLKHEMLIVDIHVMLTLATRSRDVHRLVAWREGRELYDSVNVADHDGVTKLPIRPDAFFTIEDLRRPAGANRRNFFLEADRSTETQTRFREKIRAYWHYLEQGLHAHKFDIKSFLVLTVTITEKRAENLCSLAATLLPERARKHFLFVSLTRFSLENPAPILDNVYLSARTPGTGVFHHLIPPPNPSQSES